MFNKHLKQELEALREENSRSQQIKESLYDEMLVLELDAQGRIQFANDNFVREMLYRREDLIGRTVDELVPQSFR